MPSGMDIVSIYLITYWMYIYIYIYIERWSGYIDGAGWSPSMVPMMRLGDICRQSCPGRRANITMEKTPLLSFKFGKSYISMGHVQ